MHYVESVQRKAAARRKVIGLLVSAGWVIFVVLFLLGVMAVLQGCCAVAIQDSVTSLREEFNVYRAAVVPHPSYTPEEAKKVELLGKKLDQHIATLERAVGKEDGQ